MTRIDLLFPASSRPEFTAASLAALRDNTDWSLVRALWLYIDRADAALDHVVGEWIQNCLLQLRGADFPGNCLLQLRGADFPGIYLFEDHFGGPVAIMNHWLAQPPERFEEGTILAKIDNDVIVPPCWLNYAAAVMDSHPELDILGLEPPQSRTAAPWATGKRPVAPEDAGPWVQGTTGGWNAMHGYARCDAIGGVGLVRRRAFANRAPLVPHSTYGGFTDWQLASPDLVKGWIVPPLALFLLDRLPVEPWATLSRQYIARGHQRPWTNYSPDDHQLWDWWLNAAR